MLFELRDHEAERVDAVLEAIPERFAFILVVPRRPAMRLPDRVEVVPDPRRRLAAAVRIGEPVAGGFPIGYAVIDSDRRVRYATLDPKYAEHAFEVDIVTGALS